MLLWILRKCLDRKDLNAFMVNLSEGDSVVSSLEVVMFQSAAMQCVRLVEVSQLLRKRIFSFSLLGR